ncbi:MAG: hypothetical protein ACLSAP_12615 [Oscillospiraceae bacterium]
MDGKKISLTVVAAVMTAVMAATGVSAAGVPGGGATSDAKASAQDNTRFESFLGLDTNFALLNEYYLFPYAMDGNVNMWSGNLAARYTLPYGNAYSNFIMSLTYNSQADCDIGLGRNVAMTYWAQLTRADQDTVKIMGGTGTVRTFTKNPATGKFENKEGSVEQLADGSYDAVWSEGRFQFDAAGKVASMQINQNYIQVYYNELGYVDSLMGNEQSYYFEYRRCPDGEVRCSKILSNGELFLEYDEKGNLVAGYNPAEPEQKAFSFTYGENGLVTSFKSVDTPTVSIAYQTVDGYQKVSNYNGTQIVYGKNQTIAIAPDGTVATWRFDDGGNLVGTL